MSGFFNDPGRPVDAEFLLLVQLMAQEPVEVGEMIQVGVRDEKIAHAPEFGWFKRTYVSCIQQQAAFLEFKSDIENRIAEAAVDQDGLEPIAHIAARPAARSGLSRCEGGIIPILIFRFCTRCSDLKRRHLLRCPEPPIQRESPGPGIDARQSQVGVNVSFWLFDAYHSYPCA